MNLELKEREEGMLIFEILKREYNNRFDKHSLVLLRALLYYYRDPCFRVVVLGRYCIDGKIEWNRKHCRKKLLIKYGVIIANTCKIGERFWAEHFNGIIIGTNAVIGDDCIMYQQVTIGQKNNKFPVIGNNVTIYAGAKIIGGIHIGNNVIIGANAVVLKDVPDNSIVAGVPAKVIGKVT